MCVCFRVFVRVCVCVYTYTHMCVYMSVCVCVWVYVCLMKFVDAQHRICHVSMYVWVWVYVCVLVHVCVCVRDYGDTSCGTCVFFSWLRLNAFDIYKIVFPQVVTLECVYLVATFSLC
jgi:hypothetical protein